MPSAGLAPSRIVGSRTTSLGSVKLLASPQLSQENSPAERSLPPRVSRLHSAARPSLPLVPCCASMTIASFLSDIPNLLFRISDSIHNFDESHMRRDLLDEGIDTFVSVAATSVRQNNS